MLLSEVTGISIGAENNITDSLSSCEVNEVEPYVIPAGYHDGFVTLNEGNFTFYRETNYDLFKTEYTCIWENDKKESDFPKSPELDSFLDSFRII